MKITNKEVRDWSSQRLYKDEDLKIWASTRICNSGRISGATDKDMTTKARNISTPEVCSGKGEENMPERQ
jgi:hypothetical protein